MWRIWRQVWGLERRSPQAKVDVWGRRIERKSSACVRKARHLGSQPPTASQTLGTGSGLYPKNSEKSLKSFKQGSVMAWGWSGYEETSQEATAVGHMKWGVVGVEEEWREIDGFKKSLGGEINMTRWCTDEKREVWWMTHRFLSWTTVLVMAPVSEMGNPGAW